MGRWHVYILRCRDGSLYTGATNDLARRFERHAAGKGARYTRSRLPVALVYARAARGKGAALSAEAKLKRLTRAEKLTLIARGSPDRAPPPPPARGAPRTETATRRAPQPRSRARPSPPPARGAAPGSSGT